MNSTIPSARDLVLVGGGHSNIQVLRHFGMHEQPGVRLTLVSEHTHSSYSGMIPGAIAGIHRVQETYINLERLCQFAGARFLCGKVIGLELVTKRLLLDNRPSLHYDVLSLNIGSVPEFVFDGALSIKPISEFEKHLHFLDQNIKTGQTLTVLGSGAAGIELSFSLRARYKDQIAINLIGNELPTGISSRSSRVFHEEFRRKNIQFIEGRAVNFDQKIVMLEAGSNIKTDYVVQAAGVVAQPWIELSGVETDDRGFIRVNRQLQSLSDPAIFASGDAACLEGQERPKSGVFAVRAGKVLIQNLVSFLAGKKLRNYRAQKQQLSLINCCDGRAIAVRGKFVGHGRVWGYFKNFIDRQFVGRFNNLSFMREEEIRVPKEYADEVSAKSMRCNGCGAKIAADPLRRVLARLEVFSSDSVELGIGDDSARILTANNKMLLTIDGFRALVSDPYLFGRIAAHHSLNDIFAMGASPKVALCLATVPYMSEKLMEEELYQLLSGVNDVLKEHFVSLVGGHSAEGAETSLGLMVTGIEDGPTKEKGDAQVGDVLVLTKPLGTGVVLAAASVGDAPITTLSCCYDQMNKSNYEAMRVFLSENVTALTDVTGYGLVGHLSEILKASNCGVTLNLSSVPSLQDSESLMTKGYSSSLQESNEIALSDFELGNGLTPLMPKVRMLVDPQTSGGLLACIPKKNEDNCLSRLRDLGYESEIIGSIEERVWLIQ